jgi:hypothetical protein
MFEVFKREVSLLFPEAHISLPLYEPVVGCAVLRGLKEGRTLAEMEGILSDGFAQFQYH